MSRPVTNKTKRKFYLYFFLEPYFLVLLLLLIIAIIVVLVLAWRLYKNSSTSKVQQPDSNEFTMNKLVLFVQMCKIYGSVFNI